MFQGLRLRPTILFLFVLLTMPIIFTIVAVNYFSNQQIARATAEELVGRFRKDAIGSIQNEFDPIKALVASAAAVGTKQPDFYSDTRCLQYLFSILRNSGTILSVYVGLADSARFGRPGGSAPMSRSRESCRRRASDTPFARSTRRTALQRSTSSFP